ncbi:MAG: sodium:solute symporter family protein [Sediminispirochaetaceae bacterium]
MSQLILLLALYLAIGSAIALLVMQKGQSQEDYFVGGRTVGWIVTALTYAATTYSSFMVVGLVGLAYASGVGALIFELAYLGATLLIIGLYGRKIWDLGHAHGLISPMELLSGRYGVITEKVGAVVAFIALIPYTSVQVIGLALVFEAYGISFIVGAGIAAVIICVWTFLGGLRGVAITDALQGAFMMLVVISVLVWSGGEFKGFEFSRFPNQVWTPVFFINLTLPWCFFALTNPQVLQRMFIIKERRGITKMMILFGVFGFIYTVIVTFIGFAAKEGTLNGLLPAIADRDTVIIVLMSKMGGWFALLVGLSIIFSSVSTSNSIILTLSSMLTRDVFGEKRSVLVGRIMTLVLSGLVFGFALLRPDYIVELSVASSRLLLVFVPLLLGIFHRRDCGAVTGVLTLAGGAVVAIAVSVAGFSLSSVYTFAAIFILYFLGLLIDRRRGAPLAAGKGMLN